MPPLETLPRDQLEAFHRDVDQRFRAFCGRGLALDMTRGKPAPEQLDLSQALLDLPGRDGWRTADGGDARNYYGDLAGLPEARAAFAPLLDAPPEQVLVGDNSSLALMHDSLAYALLFGVPGGRGPWTAEQPVTFLCPSPGYDRHFALCEGFGIRMLPVPLTGRGPDMDAVERLVAADPSVKGIWCVPKYANPTGETYADDVVARLAAMPAAAPDFRIFWDNAYAVHHLTDAPPRLANLLAACAAAGQADRALVFASTSKISFAGAGLAFLAASPANLAWYKGHLSRRTIGPDKLNQLRHVALLRAVGGLDALMAGHRALLAPKFRAVQETLSRLLGGTGAATWTEPPGGYFVSLDVRPGCAARVVALAKSAGIALVPAGRTFPYGRDPQDRNIRLAPSFMPAAEVATACEGVALATLLAASEQLLRAHNAAPVA